MYDSWAELFLTEGVREKRKGQYPWIPEDEYMTIVSYDPTYKGNNEFGYFYNFLMWLAKPIYKNAYKRTQYEKQLKEYNQAIQEYEVLSDEEKQNVEPPVIPEKPKYEPEYAQLEDIESLGSKDENGQHIPGVLENFQKYKKFLDSQDLLSYFKGRTDKSGISNLTSTIDKVMQKQISIEALVKLNTDVFNKAVDLGMEVVYEDDMLIIGKLTSFEQSNCFYLDSGNRKDRVTHWCTAHSESFYKSYLGQGGAYYVHLLKDNGELIQMHVPSNQFKEHNDKEYNRVEFSKKYIHNNKQLQEFYQSIGCGENYNWWDFVDVALLPNETKEEVLNKDGTAIRFIQEPTEEQIKIAVTTSGIIALNMLLKKGIIPPKETIFEAYNEKNNKNNIFNDNSKKSAKENYEILTKLKVLNKDDLIMISILFNPDLYKDYSNKNDETNLQAVKINTKTFKYIDNPTDEIIKYVFKISPKTFALEDDLSKKKIGNISDELQEELINISLYNYVYNILPVLNKLPPKDIQSKCVQNQGIYYFLKKMNNNKDLDEDIQLEAVEYYPNIAIDGTITNPSENVVIKAIQTKPSIITQIDNPTNNMILTGLRLGSYDYDKISNPTKEMMIAHFSYIATKRIKRLANDIGYISDIKPDTVKYILKLNPKAIQYVNNPTDEMIQIAFDGDCPSILEVKDIEDKWIKKAIDKNINVLGYINNFRKKTNVIEYGLRKLCKESTNFYNYEILEDTLLKEDFYNSLSKEVVKELVNTIPNKFKYLIKKHPELLTEEGMKNGIKESQFFYKDVINNPSDEIVNFAVMNKVPLHRLSQYKDKITEEALIKYIQNNNLILPEDIYTYKNFTKKVAKELINKYSSFFAHKNDIPEYLKIMSIKNDSELLIGYNEPSKEMIKEALKNMQNVSNSSDYNGTIDSLRRRYDYIFRRNDYDLSELFSSVEQMDIIKNNPILLEVPEFVEILNDDIKLKLEDMNKDKLKKDSVKLNSANACVFSEYATDDDYKQLLQEDPTKCLIYNLSDDLQLYAVKLLKKRDKLNEIAFDKVFDKFTGKKAREYIISHLQILPKYVKLKGKDQITYVDAFPNTISNISNPSKTTYKYVAKKYPEMLSYVKGKTYEDIVKTTLMDCPMNFKLLETKDDEAQILAIKGAIEKNMLLCFLSAFRATFSILHCCEEAQMLIVENNPFLINYIKEPCEEAQLKAVKSNRNCINFFKPCEKALILQKKLYDNKPISESSKKLNKKTNKKTLNEWLRYWNSL